MKRANIVHRKFSYECIQWRHGPKYTVSMDKIMECLLTDVKKNLKKKRQSVGYGLKRI